MKNHYLKFPDEYTAQEQMSAYYMDDWDRTCVDPIGAVIKPTGLFSETGDPVMVDVGGWHCNLICAELPENLMPYEVFPANPVRVWA